MLLLKSLLFPPVLPVYEADITQRWEGNFCGTVSEPSGSVSHKVNHRTVKNRQACWNWNHNRVTSCRAQGAGRGSWGFLNKCPQLDQEWVGGGLPWHLRTASRTFRNCVYWTEWQDENLLSLPCKSLLSADHWLVKMAWVLLLTTSFGMISFFYFLPYTHLGEDSCETLPLLGWRLSHGNGKHTFSSYSLPSFPLIHKPRFSPAIVQFQYSSVSWVNCAHMP